MGDKKTQQLTTTERLIAEAVAKTAWKPGDRFGHGQATLIAKQAMCSPDHVRESCKKADVLEAIHAYRQEIYTLAVDALMKNLRKGERWAVERVFDSIRDAQWSPAQTLESIKHENTLAVLDKKQNQTKELLEQYPLQTLSVVPSPVPTELPDVIEQLKH